MGQYKTESPVQYTTDGKNAPAGSLYRPRLIRVMGCVTRKPRFKHQRNNSVLRIGKRKPGPANVWAAPMRAWSSLLKITAMIITVNRGPHAEIVICQSANDQVSFSRRHRTNGSVGKEESSSFEICARID
jgi:hypothetical protein